MVRAQEYIRAEALASAAASARPRRADAAASSRSTSAGAGICSGSVVTSTSTTAILPARAPQQGPRPPGSRGRTGMGREEASGGEPRLVAWQGGSGTRTSPSSARRRRSPTSSASTSSCATPAAATSRASARSTTRSRRRCPCRPARGLYHCFGCGAGGDVIRFVQNIDHLDFTEAVERLAGAGRHPAALRRGRPAPRRASRASAARLVEAHAEAAARSTPSSWRTPEALTGARVPRRARLRPGGRRAVRLRLRAVRVGRADQAPARRKGFTPAGADRRRAVARVRPRLADRPVPPPAAVADPRRRRRRRRLRRAAAVRRRPRSRPSTSTRPRRRSTRRASCSTASTSPSARSPASTAPSSSRATPT